MDHRQAVWSVSLQRETLGSWLVWLSGFSAGLQIKRLQARFPVRAHA